MIERIPPHNEEAERSVLGAAMLNKEVLFDILEEVKEDDFYNESHKEIFRAIWELYRKNSPEWTILVIEPFTVDSAREGIEGQYDLLPFLSSPFEQLRYYYSVAKEDTHRGGSGHRERQGIREDHRRKSGDAADDPHRGGYHRKGLPKQDGG